MFTKINPYRFFMAFNWSFALVLTCMIAMLPSALEPSPVQLLTKILPAPFAVALLIAGIYASSLRRQRNVHYGLIVLCALLGLWAVHYVANQF